MFQKDFKCGGIKARVFGLQDEIVLFFRLQKFNQGLAGHSVLQAVLHLRVKIALPAPKIIIDVNNRHFCLAGPLLEDRDPLAHRNCESD